MEDSENGGKGEMQNTPGIDYGALFKIQNPWGRRRTLPEGV